MPRRIRVITMLHENCDTYVATGETVSEKRWTLFKTKMMDSLYVRRLVWSRHSPKENDIHVAKLALLRD